MVEAAELKSWLAVKDETLRREFKLKYVLKGQGSGKHQDELAKDVMGLANTAGRNHEDYAYLIIGAGDKLKPDGTRDRDDVRPYVYSRKSILDTVNARCYPSLPDLSYEEVEVDGNYYGVVTIPPSPYRHELSRDLDATSGSWKKGMVPIRRGDEVAPATFQEMLLLNQQKESWSKPTTAPLELLEEYLTAPAMQTRVRGLVIGEAKKLYAALNNEEFIKKDNDQRYAAIIERMEEYEELTHSFLELFAAGCNGGLEWLQPLWPEALSIIANPVDRRAGADALVRLRRYPALLLLYAGGVAAVAGGNYGNLAALLRRTQVRSYGPNYSVTFGLAQGRIVDSYDEKQLKENGRHRMPFNFHIVNILREPLERFVHSEDNYMESFVRFEYLFALFREAEGNGLIPGSFTWGSEQHRRLQIHLGPKVWIVRDTDAELERMGAEWPPLKSGLFDGPVERFRAFKNEADQKVARAVRGFYSR
jgi:hypothetical protein